VDPTASAPQALALVATVPTRRNRVDARARPRKVVRAIVDPTVSVRQVLAPAVTAPRPRSGDDGVGGSS
jgi:hypothetical protein